jgi:ABC-type branched-subunit amino acid transport system substrate-binding protein
MAETAATPQGSQFLSGLKRWATLTSLAVLAACQTVPKGPAKPIDKPVEGPVVDPNKLPTDAERHRIALLVPLTGSNAGVGQSIANAANMAVLDTGGKRIRVTTYDTAAGAAMAAQNAIKDGNKLILGPLLAEDVRAIQPVARASRIPIVSFSNDVSAAGQGTYLLGFVPTQSIDRIVGYAKGRGASNFAGLVPNGTYGQRASTAMLRSVEGVGGRMVAMQKYDRAAGSITAAVGRIGKVPYDAILIADSGRIAVQAVPVIRKNSNAKAQILGTELWNTEPTMAQSPAMHGAWFASVSDGLYNQLSTKYRARFGKGPFRLASLGYDSVLLVTKIAAKWKPGAEFPVAEMSDPGGFTGIDGAFRFGRDGVAERALEVQQINATGFSVLAPAPKAFAK